MLLLIGYKGDYLEAPELISIDKKGEFSWHVAYGLVETGIFAAIAFQKPISRQP